VQPAAALAAQVRGNVPTLAQRFWSHVDRNGAGPSWPEACWIWTAGLNGRDGRGYIAAGRHRVAAHRASWQLASGLSIPAGLFVLHRCDNARCVRPSHLWLGTQADNIADMDQKGRRRSGDHNARKTHCPRGHAYDGANTHSSSGRRHCRACRRDRERERYAATGKA
jgi:hypothetical protein